MTVIVVRRDDSFSQILRAASVEVVNLEMVNTEVLEDLDQFENQISRLDEYDGVFFTSPVAAAVFADRVKPPVKGTLYALGNRAATILEDAGFVIRTAPDANTAEEMLSAFGRAEFAGKRLLFVRGERSMRTIPDQLGQIATVDEIVVYRTIERDLTNAVGNETLGRLTSGDVEWLCFFSPSAAEAFEKRFGAAEVRVAAIGDTTAARARELGFAVGLVPSRATNEVFAAELVARIRD